MVESVSSPRHFVVTVHGVGDPTPGDAIENLAPLVAGADQTIRREEIRIGEDTFTQLVPERLDSPVFVAVDWTDLGRSKRGVVGVVAYLVALFFAALRFAHLGPGAGDKQVSSAEYREFDQRLYYGFFLFRWVLEGVVLWSIPLAILSMLAFTIGEPDSAFSDASFCTLLIGAVVIAALAAVVRRFSGVAFAGGMAAAVFAGFWAIVLSAAGPAEVSSGDGWTLEFLIRLTSYSYAVLQSVAGALLFPAFVVLWIPLGSRASRTRTQRISRLGLAVVALFVLSVVSRIGWAAATNYADDRALWSDWQSHYRNATMLGTIPMAELEFRMYGAMVSLALLMLLGAVVYLVARKRELSGAGRFARGWLCVSLAAGPVLMVVFAVTPGAESLATSLFALFGGPDSVHATDVAAIYLYSATRAAPYVLLLAGHLNGLVNVVGDVLLWLGTRSGAPIRSRAESRVSVLVRQLRKSGQVTVVAHSQGTLIALGSKEVRDHVPRVLTLGCPVDCLYRDFLGVEMERPKGTWWNYYRRADYIGGAVAGAVEVPLGGDSERPPGGHINYWSDSYVGDLICRMLDDRPPP